jgi:hypothetical protein
LQGLGFKKPGRWGRMSKTSRKNWLRKHELIASRSSAPEPIAGKRHALPGRVHLLTQIERPRSRDPDRETQIERPRSRHTDVDSRSL